MTTLDERRALRLVLIRMKFRKEARTPTTAGSYSERWVRTRAGSITDSIIIEWKATER